MTDKSMLTPEVKEWAEQELMKMQEDVYKLGKIDSLKNVILAINAMSTEMVNKENLISILNAGITAIEEGNKK